MHTKYALYTAKNNILNWTVWQRKDQFVESDLSDKHTSEWKELPNNLYFPNGIENVLALVYRMWAGILLVLRVWPIWDTKKNIQQ